MTWLILKVLIQIGFWSKSNENILINYIGYITTKNLSYIKINSVNPLYFIINKVDGCIEENDRNKYLTLVSNDINKDRLKMYTKLWHKIEDLIK